MTTLPVSLYLMPEWWDRHYHVGVSRASEPSQGALEVPGQASQGACERRRMPTVLEEDVP